MNIERNKAVVSDFFVRFSAGDIAGAMDSLAPDATWRLPGRPGKVPVAGEHGKQQIAGAFGQLASGLKNGLKMTVTDLVAEGDKVVAEVESFGELRNGRIYNQQHQFRMTVRDGKIHAVREYLDTQHLVETWFQE